VKYYLITLKDGKKIEVAFKNDKSLYKWLDTGHAMFITRTENLSIYPATVRKIERLPALVERKISEPISYIEDLKPLSYHHIKSHELM
jgi:hypothetical protein